jgi:alkylation response protein AidB-like acyl-CoA dehydrogenase
VTASVSPEQDELRQVVRRFLQTTSSERTVRRLMEDELGYDESAWMQMAAQLGLQGLAIPEAYGGSGYSFGELVVVLEEMGRSLLCAPYFSTVVLAANALLCSEDEVAMSAYLPSIASGELVATLALTEPDCRSGEAGVQVVAVEAADGRWLLTGIKEFVLDGCAANLIVVVARTRSGISLFTVSGETPSLTRTALPVMDQTRRQARIRFDQVPAQLLGRDGEGWATISRVLDLAAVGLAAEQVGGAARCLEMAVEYAKVRHQFGRAIGSFQAIKHKCADLLVEIESAKSAIIHAGSCVSALPDELPVMASLAKACCSDAFTHAAAENIQIHGGIGFTWEHPAQLYFKRATSSGLLFGDSNYHRELVAQRIGL